MSPRPTLVRYLVAAVTYALWSCIWPFWLLHPKLRGNFRQRLGRMPRLAPHRAGRIWLHGASAGDVLALAPTAKALRQKRPGCEIIISSVTTSGQAMAHAQRGVFDRIVFCPVDLPHGTRRAMRRLKPDMLVLEYTELWPQLMAAATAQRVPVVLHNGRIGHNRSLRYKRLFALTGNLLQHLTGLLMRDEVEAARAIALGAPAAHVRVTGNTKFDNAVPTVTKGLAASLARGCGWGPGQVIWVAGSTHEGEEEPLLRLHAQLKKNCPGAVCILAPRYPERAPRLVAAAQALGLQATRRQALPSHATAALDVLVLDTVGELASCYAMARVVFVGGSFVPRGGQNILEPAAVARPVLFGPHMHNFRDAVHVLQGRGGIQVQNIDQLRRVLTKLLPSLQACTALGLVAQAQVAAIRGAARRNAQALDTWLPSPAAQMP